MPDPKSDSLIFQPNSMLQPNAKSKENKSKAAKSAAKFVATPARDEILWAAATLFAAKGFDQTRISDISAYVDISPPTVLFYFETKARLFTEAVQAQVKVTRERFINSKRIYGTSPLQQICDVVHDQITRFARFNPVQRRLFSCAVQQSDRFPQLASEVIAVQRDMAEALLPLVTAGQKAKQLKRQEPQHTVTSFGAYRNGLGTVSENKLSDNLAAEFWTEIIVRGVYLFAPTVPFERYLDARIEAEQ